MQNKKIKLSLVAIVFAAITLMCSSGYITPDSLTATAAIEGQPTLVPTAFFVSLTPTPSQVVTPTETANPTEMSGTEPTISATSITPTATPLEEGAELPPIVYVAKSGDSLPALSAQFGVNPFEIVSGAAIPETGFITPGQILVIPQRLVLTTSDEILIPDSEIVYSSSAANFDMHNYISVLGGFLSSYRQYLGSTGINSGAQVIERVALDNSINPRILIAALEYKSHWVLGNPESFSNEDYPMGYVSNLDKGLYHQLSWAVNQLSAGYYGWRAGSLTSITFKDGSSIRLHPTLNAGTVALHYLLSQMYDRHGYDLAIDAENGFMSKYTSMFGSYQVRALEVEPLIRGELTQPQLTLPFLLKQDWYYTGGPHGAWESIGSNASIDFAPGANLPGCVPSESWVISPAPGIVTRVGIGLLIIDLDFDGDEHTGWSLLLLHIDKMDNIVPGKILEKGDFLGHPSCEGGRSTGTHLHMARKYNGEWMAADGPVSFELSGWRAVNGEDIYLGYLVRDDVTIEACTCGSFSTKIIRTENDPY